MDRGWLGFEHVGNGFWFNVTPNLTGAIGVVLVVLAVAGLAWALWRRTRLDLMLAPYVIVYFVYIGTWKELADRYLLVIVPLLLLLAARVCVELVDLARPRARRVAVPVAVVVLAVGLRPAAGRLHRLRPRAQRHRHARGGAGVDPAERARGIADRRRELRPAAGARGRARALPRGGARPGGVPPAAAQAAGAGDAGPPARPAQLRRQGVEYVVTSSRVRDRVLAAPEEYPTVVAFYAQLDAQAELVREFRPGDGGTGPVLRLYRL